MSTFANVNVGAAANDGTGDPLRDAFIKIDQNFANIADGGATGVSSVAGRSGNVVLTINDVAGAVSLSVLNSALIASNAHAISTINSFTSDAAAAIYNDVATNLSSDIADVAANIVSNSNALAPLVSFQANLTAANTHIQTLDANLGTATAQINSLLANTSGIGGVVANLGTLTSTVNALSSALTTANTGMKSYVDSVTSAWQANSHAQETEITSIGAHLDSLDAGLSAAN